LETLTELRKTHPQLPVIMFSTLTYTGATATLDALTLGASDYATKPSNSGSVEAADRHIRETLIPKIKALNKSKTVGANGRSPLHKPKAINPPIHPKPPTPSSKPIKLVAIGVSTGGPNALAILLSHLPADFPVPIAIVQHMPPVFTKLLAERLNTKCPLQVEEARSGARLTPGSVWLAPGDYHLTVKRDVNGLFLETNQNPAENSCRPSVDVLLRSIAPLCRDKFSTIAVILTGMGQDGLQGCREISHVGGEIIAQDEASSVVWGMPGFVVNAGLADRVLPLDAIAEELINRVRDRSFNSTKSNPNHEPTSV
ncbi:MAG: hypothetical protein RLZZ499_1235, partial [Cyanobacteriota bacterium]